MRILGLMSGTSLDGVDLALCNIDTSHYEIEAAETYPYSPVWREKLSNLTKASAYEYALANVDLARFFGQKINEFLKDRERPDAIASHGHTIFHQPKVGLTTQIGDGDTIAAVTGIPVVSNFRNFDVALGGQGAPLVPIGDEILFGGYDACLNLGGFANISYLADRRKKRSRKYEKVRVAYDICPCNMPLNRLAARLGLPYDDEGYSARQGKCNNRLMAKLNSLDYYTGRSGPKSLGKEWFDSTFWPVLEEYDLKTLDALATVTHHIAYQVANILRLAFCLPFSDGPSIDSVTLKKLSKPSDIAKILLVTGGGAFNKFLIELIGYYCPSVKIVVPDPMIVKYKEALIFALLGYLRLTGKVNTLSSVTGAKFDSSGGCLSGFVPKE